jgi:diguanylate cyclase (GGDEF)-like protein
LLETPDISDESSRINLPLGNTFIRFSPLTMWRAGSKPRAVLLLWLALCVIIIPSGILTRVFEWTGIAVDLGTTSIYLTIYIPMLFCVPLVMWFGFLWAAIPAYFSTFCVALFGGMPIEWIVVFAFANPIGLAMYAMFYRTTPISKDLNNLESLVGFFMIALVASLAGSIGAFIWALTNNVGLNVAYPVWLGWWFGGWLQSCLIVAPILYFFGPAVQRQLAEVKNSSLKLNNAKGSIIAMISGFIIVVLCFVGAGRYISLQQMASIDWASGQTMSLMQAQNTVDSLSYPLFILLAVILALSYLGYRAMISWYDTIKGVNQKLSEKNKQLINLVSLDPLSGLYNRRKVFEQLECEYNRSLRSQGTLSIIMVDVDKFKRVNDTYGHLVGDTVIKAIADTIQVTLRDYDTLGRFGGEEFIAILPSTSCQQAQIIAERVRAAVSKLEIVLDNTSQVLQVTVSLGVATLASTDSKAESIIDRADKALLQAKENGRNQVVFGGDQTNSTL